MKEQLRFKTKKEFIKEYSKGSINSWDGFLGNLYGNPYDKQIIPPLLEQSKDLTTAPHPFTDMDIKIRVTPKQSKRVQKKAFALGYDWGIDSQKLIALNSPYLFLNKNKAITHTIGYETYFNNHKGIELTYKQFMNGTVPKKQKKEERLIFEEYDVIIQENSIDVGCLSFTKVDLEKFSSICNRLDGYACLYKTRDFLRKHADRLLK